MCHLEVNNVHQWKIKIEEKIKSFRTRKEKKMKENDLVLNVKPFYCYSSFFLNSFLCVCVCVCARARAEMCVSMCAI